MKLLAALALVTVSALSLADYDTKVIKSGLARPTGITVSGSGHGVKHLEAVGLEGCGGHRLGHRGTSGVMTT